MSNFCKLPNVTSIAIHYPGRRLHIPSYKTQSLSRCTQRFYRQYAKNGNVLVTLKTKTQIDNMLGNVLRRRENMTVGGVFEM